MVIDKSVDPLLGRFMFVSHDQHWKDLRSTTSPAFTGSKMKQMMSLINDCTSEFIEYINSEIQNNGKVFDMKDLFRRYAANAVASTAFGFKMNTLNDKNHAFFERSYSAASLDRIQGMKFFAFQSIPNFMKFLRIPLLRQKDTEYFRKMIRENMENIVTKTKFNDQI